MDKESLLERLKAYKYMTDKTYKEIAVACEIPFSSFYNFTNGTRGLRDIYADKLDAYLKKRGV